MFGSNRNLQLDKDNEIMMSIWDAPSDRDYYDHLLRLGPEDRPADDDEQTYYDQWRDPERDRVDSSDEPVPADPASVLDECPF